ncbi:MAG: hypothetical protein IPK19_02085 [Chloroflexi bacterium]|nr:hypothetical protein [Chloroflexota bacterium]
MLPDRLAAYRTAPLGELLDLLLRQLRRPLIAHGIDLSDADCDRLGREIAGRTLASEQADPLCAALVTLVAESKAVLAAWGLTYEQSLLTELSAIPGWETTSEFLEVAAEKSNAELRISTAASILAALGDLRDNRLLLFVATGQGGEGADIEAVIARRVLSFACRVPEDAPDWEKAIRARVG